MSLSTYQVFLEIVERGTFAAAAHQLKLSPSAISHSLASLEDELGFSLFIRGKNRIKLSKGGESILPAVRAVISAHQSVLHQSSQLIGLTVGSVSIGAFNSVCAGLLPTIIKSFSLKYPSVSVSVEQGGVEDISSWIASGKVDIGFLLPPLAPGIECNEVFQDRWVCVSPKDYFGQKKSIEVHDLSEEKLISQRSDYGWNIKLLLERHGVNVQSTMGAIDAASIIALVEGGLGLAILPELALKRYSGEFDVLAFEPPEVRSIYLAASKFDALTPAAKKLHEHIKDYDFSSLFSG